MNNIEIPSTVAKSVRSNRSPMCKVINETVVIKLGKFKNGNDKITQAKIVQVSETGVYCDNDEFYPWNLF